MYVNCSLHVVHVYTCMYVCTLENYIMLVLGQLHLQCNCSLHVVYTCMLIVHYMLYMYIHVCMYVH